MTDLVHPVLATSTTSSTTVDADGRGRRWPWALLPVVATAVAVVALVGADGRRTDDALRLGLVAGWSFASLACLGREGMHRLGIVLGAGAAVGAAGALATTASGDAGQHLAGAAACLVIGVSAHALLTMPTGELGDGPARRVATATWIISGAATVAAAATGPLDAALLWTLWVVSLGIALVSSHRRYAASGAVDRQRMQWAGCGTASAVGFAVVVAGLDLLVHWPSEARYVAGWGTLLIPLAIAAAADPRLVAQVDRLLVHTVSVTGLVAVVFGLYVLVVIGLGRAPTGDERPLVGLSIAAAAIAALLWAPVSDRLQRTASRLVYGDRDGSEEVLRSFGSRLTRAMPMDELLLQLAESLKQTMRLRRAEVWTASGDVLERTVSVPHAGEGDRLPLGERERPVLARAGASGNAWASVWLPDLLEGRDGGVLRFAPIAHAGEVLGLLVAERGPGDDVFGENEDATLVELARQVGLALHNVQLDSALQATLEDVQRANEELRASRSRIVATADAERRRIERNLHDGAQQHLVALAVNLRLAKDVIDEDPASAAELLDALVESVRETIQELRDLAHGIYPPLLVDSGLSEALRASGNRSPLDVDVRADVGRYPGEVEAAIYFCCLEALQNAAKHAPGSHVDVRLWQADGTLLFEVSDDGPGFDPATAASGHGHVNMADRLGAFGGTVRWDSAPGQGTRISGAVPLDAV